MALVKFGAGIVDMRGSIAGTTFARNRGGAYARGRTKPTNPSTSRQQAVRNVMTDLVNAWSEVLTDAQRAAWDQYASAVPFTNRLGESMLLTGFNMFIRSNSVILQSGLTQVNAGPTTLLLPEADASFAVAASEATGELTVTFDDTADWCDEDGGALAVKCGLPQNASRNFFKGPWRFADSIDGDSVTAPTSSTAIAAPFSITENQKIWCEARIIRSDGRVSAPFRVSGIVGS